MSADVIQFVPRSNPNRHILDRIQGVAPNVEAVNVNEPGYPINVPYGGAGIDGMFYAPESDPA